MAKLLSQKQRELRFKYLGLGEYNKKNIRKFQKMAFPNNKDEWDSEYGIHTDRALRTFYNVKKYGGGYFEPEEFRCNCGRCCGYPSYMKKVEMEHLARIRKHYKKPMTITSGLRCGAENRRVGGVANSGHLRGYAADFCIPGVTETVSQRKKALNYMSKLPNHEFTYGAHMYDSNGLYRDASGMGNAMHSETHKPVKTPQQKICDVAKEIADSHKYKYVYYASKYGKECAICHPHGGKNKGWQCIGYVTHCWHAVINQVKCRCDSITDQIYNKLLKVSLSEATKIVQQRLGIKDIKIIRNGGKAIPLSKLQAGDWIAYYTKSGYKHTALYIGDGKIADCTSGRTPNIKYGAPSYKGMTIKLAIRYTGK